MIIVAINKSMERCKPEDISKAAAYKSLLQGHSIYICTYATPWDAFNGENPVSVMRKCNTAPCGIETTMIVTPRAIEKAA